MGSTFVREVGPAQRRCLVDTCTHQVARNSMLCGHHRNRTPARFDEIAASLYWDEGLVPGPYPVMFPTPLTCGRCPAPILAGHGAYATRDGWCHSNPGECWPEFAVEKATA